MGHGMGVGSLAFRLYDVGIRYFGQQGVLVAAWDMIF